MSEPWFSGLVLNNKILFLFGSHTPYLLPGGGGGGYSHIWAVQVCAAQQGMFFTSLTLGQGIKIALSLWNRVYFISGSTLE